MAKYFDADAVFVESSPLIPSTDPAATALALPMFPDDEDNRAQVGTASSTKNRIGICAAVILITALVIATALKLVPSIAVVNGPSAHRRPAVAGSRSRESPTATTTHPTASTAGGRGSGARSSSSSSAMQSSTAAATTSTSGGDDDDSNVVTMTVLAGGGGAAGAAAQEVEILLQPEWAPLGAARVKELCASGFYDDSRIFRVVVNFVAQFGMAGDPAVNAAWEYRYVRVATRVGPGKRNLEFTVNCGRCKSLNSGQGRRDSQPVSTPARSPA